MGLHTYYPVSVQDAFAEIIKLSFGSAKKGNYLVYPNFPSTQLGIVRCLQQIDPEITIDFISHSVPQSETSRDKHEDIEGIFVLPENYDVFSKIQEAYKENYELRINNKKSEARNPKFETNSNDQMNFISGSNRHEWISPASRRIHI